MDIDERMKIKFNENLTKLIETKGSNKGFMSKEKYIQLTNDILELKLKTTGKTPADYQRLKRYDVIEEEDSRKLIYPLKEDNQAIKYYVSTDDIFDIIHNTHIGISHGGRTRMMNELQKKYKNITAESVMLYINLCDSCQKRSKVPKKGLVVKPILFDEMNSRCWVDLIDMQINQDGEYKFILVYQDQLTKFIQLRPLRSKQAEEVADVLLDIFTSFGAPSILQCGNGAEFATKIIKELCANWEELKIVQGKTWHSSVVHMNQDIENLLSKWLETNNTSHWSEGLRFIQLMKNRAYHQAINCSPYEALFGSPIKIGLKTSWLPNEVIMNLKKEEDLENVMNQLKKNSMSEKNVNECSEVTTNVNFIKIEDDNLYEDNDEDMKKYEENINDDHDSYESMVNTKGNVDNNEETIKDIDENIGCSNGISSLQSQKQINRRRKFVKGNSTLQTKKIKK